NATPDCFTTTSFDLVVNPLPVANAAQPLVACDVNGTGSTTFTLSAAVAEILNGQTGIAVTFFETLADAEANTGALADPYTNLSNPQTVFVRLDDETTLCFATTTLELIVNPLPVANAPSDLEVCDDDADGIASFDLSLRTPEVLNGQTGMEVTYHADPTDAQ